MPNTAYLLAQNRINQRFLRNTASKVIKYIPGVNIVNDAFGAVTGQDLAGNLLLSEKEKFNAKFSTFLNAGTLGAGAYLASLEKSAALSLGETAANSASTIRKVNPDFYVNPSGEAIPGTGYRYGYGEIPSTNLIEPSSQGIRYFSFDKYDTAFGAKDGLQLLDSPTYRASFDTLQVTNNLKIPFSNWNTGNNLEPLTYSYPELGTGGGTQAITSQIIIADDFLKLP